MEVSEITVYLIILLFIQPLILFSYGEFIGISLPIYGLFSLIHSLLCIIGVLSLYSEITYVN